MKPRWIYFSLFILTWIVLGWVSAFQSSAGYMDADYYFLGGLRLAQGYGFTEPILWNYLGAPALLPQPSHGYWMPLASLLAWAGIELTGNSGFSGARILLLTCASLLPPLTAALGFRLTGRSGLALLAGLFAVFSSFYLPFLGTTDTFGLYMLFGGLFFLFLGVFTRPKLTNRDSSLATFALGGITGFMHLARADGPLWLVVTAAVLVWAAWRRQKDLDEPGAGWGEYTRLGGALGLLLAGYLLVMGPWFIRNFAVFGQPLAPGGSRALWLLDYNELFSFPASILTPSRWWQSGLAEILSARFGALGLNLGNALAVQGQIFLAPLVLLGAWRLRKDIRVQAGVLAWGLTLIAMTIVFPFPGSRGGFFHSGAALQPLVWALAPVGLIVCIEWGHRRRGWDLNQATRVFGAGLVVIAMALSWTVVQRRVVGADPVNPAWAQSDEAFAGIEAALRAAGASDGDPVLINNPPGFYLASGRPAIVIPDGGVETLRQAAAFYQADYVVLEANHPQALDGLYRAPGDRPGLDFLASADGTYIYYVER